MARFEYDDSDVHLSSVAQSCRYLNSRARSSGHGASEGITCSICSNWDGSSCAKKAFDNVLNELELD